MKTPFDVDIVFAVCNRGSVVLWSLLAWSSAKVRVCARARAKAYLDVTRPTRLLSSSSPPAADTSASGVMYSLLSTSGPTSAEVGGADMHETQRLCAYHVKQVRVVEHGGAVALGGAAHRRTHVPRRTRMSRSRERGELASDRASDHGLIDACSVREALRGAQHAGPSGASPYHQGSVSTEADEHGRYAPSQRKVFPLLLTHDENAVRGIVTGFVRQKDVV